MTTLTKVKEDAVIARERDLRNHKALAERKSLREQHEKVRGLVAVPVKNFLTQEGERPRKNIARLTSPPQMDVPMEIVDDKHISSTSVSAPRRKTISVAEQRARAKAWAEEEAAKSQNIKGKVDAPTKSKARTGNRKSLSIAEAVDQARREEEERAEAAARNCLTDASNVINSARRKSVRKGA